MILSPMGPPVRINLRAIHLVMQPRNGAPPELVSGGTRGHHAIVVGHIANRDDAAAHVPASPIHVQTTSASSDGESPKRIIGIPFCRRMPDLLATQSA